MTDSTRLERALEVWLRFQSEGGDRDQLLAGHPELADLLVSMFDDEQPAGPLAEQVIGDFRIVREVGRGGMGVVYEARQRSLDRRIALKVLAPHLAARPVALARFKREALLLARFDHPGIVRVFDVGEDQGQNWLAMEFVDGEPLLARLYRPRGPGPFPAVVGVHGGAWTSGDSARVRSRSSRRSCSRRSE